MGLEQKDSKNHKVGSSYYAIWLYPLLWMLRRSIFMAITIFLFDYPILQFAANYFLSMAYIAYLVHQKALYEDGKRRFVEVFTEFMILTSTVLLQ